MAFASILTNGTNITITGDGSDTNPYVINSTASGGANIDGSGTGAVAAAHSGDTVTASSTQAIAIGKFASANTGAEAIAIGGGAAAFNAPQATGQGGIAIGASNGSAGVRASGAQSIAIGSSDASTASPVASSVGGVAIGGGAAFVSTSVVANYGIALGLGATVQSGATNGIAIGAGDASVFGATANAVKAIALGYAANAAITQGIAIGANAVASTGAEAIAIGSGVSTTAAPQATGQGSIAIGASDGGAVLGARAIAIGSVAIGSGDATNAGAAANGTGGVAIGASSIAGGAGDVNNTALGHFAACTTGVVGGVALGGGVSVNASARCDSSGSIAIGGNGTAGIAGSRVTGPNAIAIGASDGSNAGAIAGQNAIAMGLLSSAVATGISLGLQSTAGQAHSLALGRFAVTSGSTQTIALGSGLSATSGPAASAQGAIAIGSSNDTGVAGAKASAVGTVAIGSGNSTEVGPAASAQTAIAIGTAAVASVAQAVACGYTATASGNGAVAVGDSSSANTTHNVAIGKNAWAITGTQTIAIGGGVNTTANPQATAQGAISLGASNAAGVVGSRATGISSIAIGSGDATVAGASATASQAIAIGRTASATHATAVALGAGATTTAANQIMLGTASEVVQAPGGIVAPLTANRQTASYVLVLSDAGKVIEMNVAGANNLTVPPNSSVAFATGTILELLQYGAGQTTVVAGAGVTIRSPSGSLKLATQYAGASLRKIATDEWALEGDLTA